METTEYSRQRRVQRIRLASPIIGRFGATDVVLVDVSLDGARVEHRDAIKTGIQAKLSFTWNDEPIAIDASVTRCRLERVSNTSGGLSVYQSGLRFEPAPGQSASALRSMIAWHISRALEEQKANAKGELPPSTENMPIFRGGVLTDNPGNAAKGVETSELLPSGRIARASGYIRCRLDRNQWKRTHTEDPTQPEEGFTVSATEDLAQIEDLCAVYERSNTTGRELIRTLARLSITEGEGIEPGRFRP